MGAFLITAILVAVLFEVNRTSENRSDRLKNKGLLSILEVNGEEIQGYRCLFNDDEYLFYDSDGILIDKDINAVAYISAPEESEDPLNYTGYVDPLYVDWRFPVPFRVDDRSY